MREEQIQPILQSFRKLLVVLIGNFHGGDYELRKESAIALSKFKGEPTTEFLISNFASDNIQDFMALALGNLDSQRAVGLLVQALNDPQHEVRFHAARALGMSTNNDAFNVLMDALNSYLDTSASGNPEGRPGMLFFEEEAVISAIHALGQLRNPLATSLLKRLLAQEKNARIRASVIAALGAMATDRMMPIFQAALRDENDRVRANAIEAIESIKSSSVVAVLQPYLEDPSNRVRANVAKAIWKFGDYEVSNTLAAMMADPDKWQRASAAYAMGEMRDVRFISHLVKALKDADPDVRRNAARALRQLEKAEAAPHLEPLLADESHEVRLHGALALHRCARRHATEVFLRRLPAEEHPMVCATLISCLGESERPELIEELLPYLKNADARVVANTIDATQKLTAASVPAPALVVAVQSQLNHEDNRVKSNAIKALWQWEVFSVLDDLVKMLSSRDARPRLSATFALGEIGHALAAAPESPLARRISALIAEQLARATDPSGFTGSDALAAQAGDEPQPASPPAPTIDAGADLEPVPPLTDDPTTMPLPVTGPSAPHPADGSAAGPATDTGPAAGADARTPAPPARNFEAQLEQAAIYFNERHFDEAERLYTTVLQDNPDHLHALMGVANLYMECKRFDEAAVHFERALAISPNLVKAHYNLGTIRYFQKDFDRARTHLLEAIRLYPKILGAYLILAQIFQLSGETSASIDLLSRAIRLNPRNPVLFQKLAVLLLFERRYPQAAKVLEQAVSLAPLDTEAHMTLALTRQAMDDAAAGLVAMDACLRACAQSPRPEEALRSMLRAYVSFKTHFAPATPPETPSA